MNRTLEQRLIDPLKTIAKILDEHKISWSLGGSALLYLKGIDVKVNDLDIVVNCTESELLNALKGLKSEPIKKNLTSDFLIQLNIGSVEFDFIGNFKISYNNVLYAIPNTISSMESGIPLDSLEYWLYAYFLLKRQEKVDLIFNHLNKTGFNKDYIQRLLELDLPEEFRKMIINKDPN